MEITKDEVLAVENQLFQAQLSSDADTLNVLLYDHLVAMGPSGEMMTKEMDLNAHRTRSMIIEEATTEVNHITLLGDTATTIVTMHAKGKMMGTPLEGQFRYFRVWKRVNQSLQVIGASFMQLP